MEVIADVVAWLLRLVGIGNGAPYPRQSAAQIDPDYMREVLGLLRLSDLRGLAHDLGIPGMSRARRAELIEALVNHGMHQ